MRGGVTLRAQDLTRLPSDVLGEIREMHPLLTPKLNNITLRHAVNNYFNNDFRIRHYIIYRYGEIGDWDVSNVTDMGSMFNGISSFNQPLNNWNVSNVKTMRWTFYGAINKWNVSNLYFMWGMFDGASSFNQPLHAPWYHEESESE